MPGTGTDFADIDELYTFVSEIVDFLDEVDQVGQSNSPNFRGLYDDALADVGGRHAPAALASIRRALSEIAAVVTPDRLTSQTYLPIVTEALKIYSKPRSGSFEERLYRLIEHLHSQSELFLSRGFTFGNPTLFSGGTGTGDMRRCTTDRRGYALEGTGSEAKQAVVEAEQNTGSRRHREVWTFDGATPSEDYLKWTGSGRMGTLATADCLSPGTPLLNPSFEQGAGTTDGATPSSTTQITGWTMSATASFQIKVETEQTSPHAKVYKGYEGSPIGTNFLAALKFVADGNIEQVIFRNSRRQLDRNRPYYGHLAVCRRDSATGTLTLEIGNKTVSLDVSTLTNDVWALLEWPTDGSDPGQNNWPDNWVEDLTNVKVTMASLATGTVDIDDLVLVPMTNMDGTYYLPVGGATPFGLLDKFTWTDSEGGTRAKHSYWLWRAFLEGQRTSAARMQALGGVWLPTTTTSSSVTIAD